MPQTVIENPVINSPFTEPDKHFRFTDEGITDEVITGRRVSSRFVPIAQPKKKGKQLTFDTEWTQDRIEENAMVNRIRERISLWRNGGYAGVTSTTRRLLDYWTSAEREKKFFFCQIEALETAIYMTETASRYGDSWMEAMLREANESSNPGLPRIAFKMATGTGKTVVMGMLIAWQALNKLENPQDARFTNSFLIITPGITIRDRLRVLFPNDPENYYRQRDIIPTDQLQKLGQAKIIITNFHTFLPREKIKAGKLTKSLLADGKNGVFTETPDQVVRRVCREFGTKKNIIVINDEAHHCYWKKAEGETEKVTGDERKEVESREKDARIWISGIESVKAKIGVKNIFDLSATPFFLKGSGWSEGTLFPWVVSDFSLIDAIEAGIVKVPRVPVSDDSMTGALPTYRNIWMRIRDELPKKGRRTDAIIGEPVLPKELEGALHSLYSNYEKYYRLWEENIEAQAKGRTPPVFIVVCNNTNVSKLVFDHIAGWEKKIGEATVVQAGALPIFRNDDEHGGWLSRPNTILVDSQQLESGEAMSEEFKKIASREIEEFKAEYRVRFPGRDTDKLTDEDILREVMNTVGKQGKLGEHVKCVVSVSMLTEGWDAQTVTHVLGVRAFGTQLLCEQVVGRALRRMSYATNDKGMFTPEYAEVYGIPFSFIPCSGSTTAPELGPTPTRVRALDERISCEITFPRLRGYRYELGSEQLTATFSEDSRMALSTADIPTKTENAPVVGESSFHTLDDLKRRRPNEVAFLLAKVTLEKYFRDEDGNDKPWLFPQLLGITKRWLEECVDYKDNAFVQLLWFTQSANTAADRIYHSIVQSAAGSPRLTPILQPYDTLGTTRFVDFDTIRGTFQTRADKCNVNYVVGDTQDWEQKTAMALEDMDEMIRYVKNDHLGFTIPYTFEGEEHQYIPDFIAAMDDGHGIDNPLNLIVEVTGERKPEKAAKVSTAKTLWVPAVNNHGGFGRWAFFEVTDPHNVKNSIRGYLKTRVSE